MYGDGLSYIQLYSHMLVMINVKKNVADNVVECDVFFILVPKID